VTGRYRREYRWSQIRLLAPVCGVAVGVLTSIDTHQTLGPALSGLGAMVGIVTLWGYRIWYQRNREHS
jgi:hypothetical protein